MSGEIISRAEAKARGLTRFFTGKPCQRGHVADRWTATKACVVCAKENGDRWREKHREKLREKAKDNKQYYAEWWKSRPPEYVNWQGMKARCNDFSNPNYGGRGITVCERWKSSFKNFLEDMGPKPSPEHSLERLDYNGNYGPDNCIWATPEEQARNKRTVRELQSEIDGYKARIEMQGREIAALRAEIEEILAYYEPRKAA